ncbi:MAG: diguanylate cyclase [Pseudomonadales bacterium]|nr:diguanylate cyclase [Pseudomonadales bacterium]
MIEKLKMDNTQLDNKTNAQSKALRRFFAKRVTNQVRLLLDVWRLTNQENWSHQRLKDLLSANEKLIRYAKHFEEDSHLHLAEEIHHLLVAINKDKVAPSSDQLYRLTDLIQTLSETALRKGDFEGDIGSVITPKKPIYIALNDQKQGCKLARQLEFFGFRTEYCSTLEAFNTQMLKRHPAAIVMDVNLNQEAHLGINVIQQVQDRVENTIPTIFYSENDGDIFTRLKACRAGGIHFHSEDLEMGLVVEEVEAATQNSPASPLRILVIEDSETQAFAIQTILNNAGMISLIITDPMLVLDSLETFQPEIIIMDMYMPRCTGMEVANVIRQQEKYVSIPIIYLSAEEDIEKQLHAMSHGGDEFLQKPIKASHLISTLRTKGERARALISLMVRDSLTGLLNHTRILQALDKEILRAQANKTPLCFAMLDIDHFKNINDSYGHPVGDRVIKNLALLLKQRLRKSDAIGRYGGEEFAIVLSNTNLADAVRICDSIREHFSQFRHPIEGSEFQVTFSCGVVQLDDDNGEKLTIIADEALYDAKHNGRNQVCSPSLSEQDSSSH